jgi:hypothetical protein
MLVADARIPSFPSSPLIRRYPHRGFSLAITRISLQTSGSIAGRPGRRCGLVHFRATSDRCQRRSVSGRTRNAPQCSFGKDPACRSEQRAVPAPVDRALDLPAQDPELVAKDEDLDLCDMVGAMVRCDKGEEPTKHQVEE